MPEDGAAAAVQVFVLGPVEVRVGERPVDLPPLVRTLVAVLAADAGRVVSVSALADALWHGDPPPSARNRVQQAVSALRRALAAAGARSGGDGGLVVTSPPGYVLRADERVLDVVRFSALVERARATAGGPVAAAALHREALGLWRGMAFGGVSAARLELEAAGLEELRLAVLEECVTAELAAGRAADLVAELTRLVIEHPLRERIRGLLMLALYRCGREADALATYRAGYEIAAREVGVKPGVDLQTLHKAILTRDPSLSSVYGGHVSVPRQVPATIADFTGRKRELARLRELLVARAGSAGLAPAVVVVTGMGGIGKSTVAVRAARDAADAFPDGSLYADLRGITADPASPHSVLSSFLRSLGVPGRQVPTDPDERLACFRSETAERRLLVVLDDAGVEAQVRPLIPAGAGCAVVITARAPLLGLEAVARLPLDVLSTSEGLALLDAVAGPGLLVEPASAERLVELCGGLPLAVRLAGARLAGTDGLTLSRFVARLSEQDGALDVLAAGDRSVRATLMLSYAPLDPDAARLFRLVATLPGADLTALSCAMALDLTRGAARVPLERLLQAQLVAPTGSTGDPRYRQHDLVRRFAVERAGAEETRSTRDDALRRLLDHHTDTAYAGGELLTTGRARHLFEHELKQAEPVRFGSEREAMAWFAAERANLRDGVLAASHRGLHAQAWRLAHALRSFYRRAAELDDWHATSHAGLASAIALGDPVAEVRIRETLGSVHLESARPVEAIEQWTTTLARLAELGDALGLGRSHVSLGVAHGRLGQLETAIGHIRAALAIPEFAANPQQAAFGEMTLGVKYGELGDYDQAGQAFTRALMVARRFGDSEVICFAEHNLAELFLRAGDLAAAETHARAEIELAAQVHYPLREARGWDILGTILRDRDSGHDSAAARAAWQQALTLYESLASPLADEVRARLLTR